MIKAKNIFLEIIGLIWYPNMSKKLDEVEGK